MNDFYQNLTYINSNTNGNCKLSGLRVKQADIVAKKNMKLNTEIFKRTVPRANSIEI